MGEETAQKVSEATPVHTYGWLRGFIRITGILLMFGGALYLGAMAASLLVAKKGGGLLGVVITLVALGIGIYVLRVGIDMLRTVDARAIKCFSFIFALIYTSILLNILPSFDFFGQHPAALYLMLFLYLGLSYWIVKYILFHLLLPPDQR